MICWGRRPGWPPCPIVQENGTIELQFKTPYFKKIMRPLFHPSIDDVRPGAVLHALSDPVRAAIFADIAGAGCAQTCQAFASMGDRVIPKSSLSQHFKVLREAGLIRSERQGVEMRNTSRCAEVDERFPGLIPAILGAYVKDRQPA
ncbi:ArsR/SmtB family transcription factor [Sphingomonas sp. MMS24-J13]|uniref:ArsR/SmtB family transcription factor n=1 Tax=Sphingomonas sp. MMS24-J13 TaxID=3238686 RepID=UPI00384CEA67